MSEPAPKAPYSARRLVKWAGISALLGVVATVAICVSVARQPASFRVERSIKIAATPDVPFALVNDLHQWSKWSPWENLDPNMSRSYDGPDAGVGAKYSWKGDSKVGSGVITVQESEPPNRIQLHMELSRPYKDITTLEFTFKPVDDQTEVTWSITGQKPYITKLLGTIVNMDEVVGSGFEEGLAKMKKVAENQPTD